MITPASRKVGPYEIRHKLGRGGMADVYLALDTQSGGDVALKLIEHSPDPDTQDFIVAERRGAGLQARLAEIAPQVARVFDCGDIDGYFYIAMEYVEGRDLAELLRAGPLPPDEAVDIAVAVAATLDSAHNLEVDVEGKTYRGIVHGDIKPKNIRIDTRSQVRVLDFGIAKALSLSRKLTRNEFGSVPYSSPERLEAGQVDVHSDLWSLAVMLYEMVTGLQPYQADTTERLERMIRSRIAPPPAPDPCPEALRRILKKAMMPDPEARYQSAREFANDLILFRTGGPVAAVTEDLDSTRRTFRRAEPIDSDDTRRTAAAEPADENETRRTSGFRKPDEVLKWPPKKAGPVNPLARQVLRGTLALVCLGVLWAVWSGISGYLLYKHGREFERSIQTEAITDPDTIWKEWKELSKDDPSSFLLREPRKVVRQKLVEAADRVIASYRNSETVSESGWKGARNYLADALSIDPDNQVRGELRLAEGHLLRISAGNRRSASEFNQAIDKFNEAQHLLPNSPDPALGLARVYISGLHDIDHAYQALEQAEKHGHGLGSREIAQIADGYRERANRVYWESRKVRDLPGEKDQLLKAMQDYQRALELYQSITPYGNSASYMEDVQASLDGIQNRLHEVEHHGVGKAVTGALEKLLKIWR